MKSANIAALFDGWHDTMITSCLTGSMGKIITSENEKSAAAIIADFAFFAGEPDESLLSGSPSAREGDFSILIPCSSGWETLIEAYFGEKVTRVTRYATEKVDFFDKEKLTALAKNVQECYNLAIIDKDLFEQTKSLDWSKDLCGQFADYGEYEKHGIGVCAVDESGTAVAGASSYTWYPGGIEVEIDTSPAHRRRGLGKAVGASLVLACLERGLYPGWDAHNKASLRIAEELGYKLSGEYTAYEKR